MIDNLDAIRCLSDVRQLDKHQDYSQTFSSSDIENGQRWKGGFIADGHGLKYDSYMDIIKNIDYVPLVSHIDPIPFILNEINELTQECSINNGMTFILVKIYENRN